MNAYARTTKPRKCQQAAQRNTADHKIRVYGYCRVSTDMQAQHGLSLDAQQETSGALLPIGVGSSTRFLSMVATPAKNTDRPAFQRMVREIKNSDGAISAVVVTKLDRPDRCATSA